MTAAISMSWLKKGNTELLNEIDYAIDQMNAVEGDWKTTLYNKNYESIETKNLEYTKKEKSIISQYSNKFQFVDIENTLPAIMVERVSYVFCIALFFPSFQGTPFP